MFGSQILEVGIGLILIFLLVSLVLTAVRETLEGWMKSRSRDLELAIAQLLDDEAGTGARLQLYQHPLIQALFPGNPRPTAFTNGGSQKDSNLPSYIPRETFALAVEDLVRSGAITGRAKEVYDALVQAEGADLGAARRRLEQWYDAAMDRASGWYRRRTQKILLVLGVIVAVTLNINAITIARYLAVNDDARAKVVQIADTYRRDNAAEARTNPPVAAPGSNAADAGTNAAEANLTGDATTVNQVVTTNRPPRGTGGSGEPPLSGADAARQLNSLVSVVGLPIGWDEFQLRRMGAEWRQDGLAALLCWLLGWLMVGFAATLGAPFWFDLLGKFMVIRSTVKPTEKSPDEASKDGGTGGAPRPAEDAATGGGSAPAGPAVDRGLQTPNPVMFG